MVRDPFAHEEAPDAPAVLAALDDPDCRRIIRALETPHSARELSEACDMPLSTTYRKLELLTDASIIAERTRIREGGHHTTQYSLDVEAVHLSLNEDRELEVAITRPARTADEQLAQLWSEVRRGA